MRMGVPASSVNCLDGCAFFALESIALGTGAMRVPSPAAGMMTITFMAGLSVYERQARKFKCRDQRRAYRDAKESATGSLANVPVPRTNCRELRRALFAVHDSGCRDSRRSRCRHSYRSVRHGHG